MCYASWMDTSGPYRFRKATSDDLGLLTCWRSTPHVREWWASDASDVEADLVDRRVSRWIVSLAGRPFAFMQDYTVHGWPDHHFAGLTEGSRGIDQFIGDPAMLDVGHGSAFIGRRMQALFDQGVPVVATDPHPGNERAIAVYEKLGFKRSGPTEQTRWGPIVPMLATP